MLSSFAADFAPLVQHFGLSLSQLLQPCSAQACAAGREWQTASRNYVPGMEYTANAVVPFDAHLLQGCFREAARAEIVAASIDQLRLLLAANFHGHLLLLSEQIRNTSRSLRDLADRSQVSLSRVPLVMDSLNVVLPCLSRSLRDITAYYEDTSMTKENRCRFGDSCTHVARGAEC